MKTILSEKAIHRWLGTSAWQLERLRNDHDLPYFALTRELRVYSKQSVGQWILAHPERPVSCPPIDHQFR